jgi:beta-lactamase regulating signal transducer with metallopeptidase domain
MSGGGIGWESAVGLRLGWALLHSLWQIALVVGVGACLLALIRKSARARYAVAYGALMLALLVPLATLFVGTAPPSQTELQPFQVVSAQPGGAEPIQPEGTGPFTSIPQTPMLDDTFVPWYAPTEASAPFEVVVDTASRPDVPRFGKMIESTATWLGPFWLFGVFVLALRQLGGWWLARRMGASAESLDNEVLCGIVERLSHSMGMRRRVRVLRSSLAGVPMVLGAFRPAVLVPVALATGLPPQQWEAILAHELAHIRRYDFLMNLVQVVVETLLFYHPALWWLSRRVRIERELCCDDVAALYCGTPTILAEALVAIETSRAASRLAVAAVGSIGRHSTLHRVRRLLGVSEPGRRRGTTWLAGVVVLLVVVFGWALGRVSLGPGELTAEEVAASNDSASEDKAVVAPVASEGPGSTILATVFPNGQSFELAEIREFPLDKEPGEVVTVRRWKPDGTPLPTVEKKLKEHDAVRSEADGDMARLFCFQSGDVAFSDSSYGHATMPVRIGYRADGAKPDPVAHEGIGTIDKHNHHSYDSFVRARFSGTRKQTNLYLQCDDGLDQCSIEFRDISLEPEHKTEPRIYSLDCLNWITDPRERLQHCKAKDEAIFAQPVQGEGELERARLRKYGWASLRQQAHGAIWPPTIIPTIRATVVDDAGRPVKGAKVRPYTARDSVRILPGGRFRGNAPGDLETDSQGRFRLPSREEHYRIFVVHDCGVASMDCEELLRTKRVVVRPWARVEGTVVFDGEPQVGETLVMAFEPSTWSYGKLGRNNLSFRCRAVTDKNGRFAFEGVPPLAGMVFRDNGGLYNMTRFEATHGETTTLHLGAGHTVIGRLRTNAKSDQEPVDWSTATVELSSGRPALPASFKPDDSVPRGTWLREWHRTDEGRRWLAKLERDTHQDYIADVASDGSFKVHGVLAGEYEYSVFVHHRNAPGITLVVPAGRPGATRTPFRILEETENPLDLGEVLVEPMSASVSEGSPATNELPAEEVAVSGERDAGDSAVVPQVAPEGPGSTVLATVFPNGQTLELVEVWESLPPTTIPSIRATVVDEAGQPIAGAKVCSHTRRHWERLHTGGKLHEPPHGSLTETDSQGRFGLPTRKERYRVLVVHDRGVASMNYEELLESKRVVLRPWARVEGTVVFDGERQAGEELTLRVDTSSWSYDRGGPRVTLDYRATTDEEGRFAFEAVPPLPGQIYRLAEIEGGAVLSHLTPFAAAHGKTSIVHLGTGHTVNGRLEHRSESDDDRVDWSTMRVKFWQPNQPIPVPDEIRKLGNQAATQLWIRGWKSSVEGRRWYAELDRRVNQRYVADVGADGSFLVHGLSEGEYLISIHDKDTHAATFRVSDQAPNGLGMPWNRLRIFEETETPLDLGELLVEPMPATASEGSPKYIHGEAANADGVREIKGRGH